MIPIEMAKFSGKAHLDLEDQDGILSALPWPLSYLGKPLTFMWGESITCFLTMKMRLPNQRRFQAKNSSNIGCILNISLSITKKCPRVWEISIPCAIY